MFQNLMTRSYREFELPVSNFNIAFLNLLKLSIFILVELTQFGHIRRKWTLRFGAFNFSTQRWSDDEVENSRIRN
jgi:hypothetical protein